MEETVAKKIPQGSTELSLYINKELKRKFKLACTAEEKPMSEVVTALIDQWLTQKETDSARPVSEDSPGEVSEQVSEKDNGDKGG
ncbi:helix-turn-helix protein, CopG [Microseira wollei NIES-4236]|uniref:Helix-turn-helix protein, CopG n=2 Tax=Microseira wollei TaxID=467598 RepID=A0AAV3XD80_9CYAN|nr:helix-turn-helix protein, CopG [Microseira wollei NIES-4236]